MKLDDNAEHDDSQKTQSGQGGPDFPILPSVKVVELLPEVALLLEWGIVPRRSRLREGYLHMRFFFDLQFL
jgi:hypothetical protein